MKIAIIQITSVLEPKINLEKIDSLIKEGKKEGATHFFLPEVFYSMSSGSAPTPYLVEEENEHFANIKNLALKNKIFLIGGSAATKFNDLVVNRTYSFTPDGDLLPSYDKINLFKIDLTEKKTKTVLDESLVYTAGSKPTLLDLGEFKVGLSICFDLRFPELYRGYRRMGANLMSIPAAFTRPTGAAHWHTLLRARAIETQSYVVASAQVGVHNEKKSTFGHSLVVDPWGKVLLDLEDKETVGVIDLDLGYIHEVRSRMKII